LELSAFGVSESCPALFDSELAFLKEVEGDEVEIGVEDCPDGALQFI
jgi:hypothetical protein